VNLLLDTHVFLWWDKPGTVLNPGAKAAIQDQRNEIFVSAASVWEIALKRNRGKLNFSGSAVVAIGANGFHELPILPLEAEDAGGLAWPHTDPFDRLLVAQALRHGMSFVTADAAIRAFGGVPMIWAG